MSGTQKQRAAEIQIAIRDVLLQDWAPIPAPVPADEYDAYVGRIYRLLISRPSRESVAHELMKIERDDIGIGPTTEEALFPIADKLLSLNVYIAS